MKRLCVLGSTGSIGVSTLDVVGRHPERFRFVALTANGNADLLFEQCQRHRPDYAVLLDEARVPELRERLARVGLASIQVLTGKSALETVASLPEVDGVMAAIVGAAGLMPALAAARAGKTIYLANKEALVMSGPLFMEAVRTSGAMLLPIDSEHNAIFQCMPAGYHAGCAAPEVRRILLTASGGPFRTKSLDELHAVTPDQACAHPNWVMGRKISVDSATMMNKGLELIEACLLFHCPPARVEVVVHKESVIHSMVDYVDGSVLAQMGNPDMRVPIAHALAWPERVDSGVAALDLIAVGQLNFEAPDVGRFPCLRLSRAAAEGGGNLPAALNAANEVAVASFLDGKIRYTGIPAVIEDVMTRVPQGPADTLEQVLATDAEARRLADTALRSYTR